MMKVPVAFCLSLAVVISCHRSATGQQQIEKPEQKVTINRTEDLLAAAGGHYDHGHEEKKIDFSKKSGHVGGSSKGLKDYNQKKWKDNDKLWGEKGWKQYGDNKKLKDTAWKKKGINQHDTYHKKNAGKEDASKWTKWSDKKDWTTDKGQGYVKAYSYDKSHGSKKSFGDKGNTYKSNYYKDKGGASGLKKTGSSGHDTKKKSTNSGDSGWSGHGKISGSSGKKNSGTSKWKVKKPSSYLSKHAVAEEPKHEKHHHGGGGHEHHEGGHEEHGGGHYDEHKEYDHKPVHYSEGGHKHVKQSHGYESHDDGHQLYHDHPVILAGEGQESGYEMLGDDHSALGELIY